VNWAYGVMKRHVLEKKGRENWVVAAGFQTKKEPLVEKAVPLDGYWLVAFQILYRLPEEPTWKGVSNLPVEL
jgi:hypothetical protein